MGASSQEWFGRLEQEHDNLRSALDWSLVNEPATALRIAGSLWWFWQTRGYLTEGRDWIRRALSVAADGDPSDLTEAMLGGCFMAVMQGAPLAALTLQERGLALATESNDQLRIAQMLFLGSFAHRGAGEHVTAIELAERSLEIIRKDHCDVWLPFALNRLGIELSETGDEVRGNELFQEAHDLWQNQGNEWGVVTTLVNLALGARNRGECHKAVESLTSCLPLASRQGDPWGVAETCMALAGLAELLGDSVTAVRFQGAAELVKQRIGLKIQRYIDPLLAEPPGLPGPLGPEGYQRAWEEVGAAGVDDLVKWGADLLNSATRNATVPEIAPPRRRDPGGSIGDVEPLRQGLSAPEIEVLRLMADGLSSREIGEALFISPRTATTHVSNIFAKLDVDSRASAVTKAFRLGLI